MSRTDQEKWDSRYREQGSEDAYTPSGLLESALARMHAERGDLRGLTALDLACGGGRNSLRLAEAGFRVDAVDISAEGLTLAKQRAAHRPLAGTDNDPGARINWIQADLDTGPPVTGPYDLILMIRYLNLPLLTKAITLLTPGGVLVAELHMHPGNEPVSGPRNPDFLVPPGALAELTRTLTPWIMEEGIVQTAPDRQEALARFVGISHLHDS